MTSGRRRLAFALFAVSFGTKVATPLFLIYEERLGLSRWTVTALFAIYPIGLAPALAYAGPASDALGRRRLIVPGIVLSGAASLVMMVGADSLWLLFFGRLLLGAVSGIVLVVASAWMQEIGDADPMRIARSLGLLMYAGFGLGPLVSGVLGQWSNRPLVWPYAIHLALVAGALVVIGKVPETVVPSGANVRPSWGIPPEASAEFWRIVVPTAIGVFVFPSLAFGLFPVLLRPQMADVAVFVTGLVFVLAMGLILPAQFWVGRVGQYRAAPVGLALGAVGTLLGFVAFASGWWGVLFPASMLLGTASGISMTSGLRFIDQLVDPTQRGALTGSFYAAAYAGMMAPLVASTLARAVGYELVLGCISGLAAALAVWLFLAIRGLQIGRSVPS
ncbi:MAG TPA: MFS transporter [Ilumatobacter sp.]|nr:MFS transporter [Ilumatobacter sp.]